VSLAIVTPWRDHLDLEPDYFAAINVGNPDQLVVVDDGSDTRLPFAAVRLDTPVGFCTATNAGLATVETEHVLFLNNDVSALRPGWLDEIRGAITPGVIVGPLRTDPHGHVDGKPYPYIDGWCLGMTTEDARSLGGWDERYDKVGPAYFSDNAFSLQARLHGMTLRELHPGLAHKGGQTGGVGPQFQYALVVNGPLFAEQVREAVGG
jgi:GT2 family glycosyltransferase